MIFIVEKASQNNLFLCFLTVSRRNKNLRKLLYSDKLYGNVATKTQGQIYKFN